MDKRELSEQDIASKYITPAIQRAGWDLMTQVREQLSLTAGQVKVRGQLATRAKGYRADYVLYHKPGIPLAVIEAKDNKHGVGSGLEQALTYARLLDVPFAFSSNGDAFVFHDLTKDDETLEQEVSLEAFPDPQDLWYRYCVWKGIPDPVRALYAQDYYDDGSGRGPRYYQLAAINRTVEAIVKGQDRVLLVMATGTGKTYTAFQIIWRLWKSGAKKRILFLADRNILVDQARTNDFKPFGSAMTKISERIVDPSYEIYLSLYQAVTGNEEERNVYKQFPPGFFDLIVVDECHRGSAAEDSAWREILEYFSGATQIGLTATPKETKDISNTDYFGEPVYTYSLRQGIEDGFLAPYKVVRIDTDKDLEGWRPTKGQADKYGRPIEDREYSRSDYDRKIILDKRTELVAKKITEFLEKTGPMQKTIVFCETVDHAERLRSALVRANARRVKQNPKYVMRITGDSFEGKTELDNFILPWEAYPVVVTTSRLLNTGVDAQTCKVVVLDQTINSMTTFKQIIGRGTRINEEYNKLFFTILDFKGATRLFADPDFDGEPVQIYEPGPDDDITPPDEPGKDGGTLVDPPRPPFTLDPPGPPPLVYVINDVEVRVLSERVQYLDGEGKLITESLTDYTRKKVKGAFATLEAFLGKWNRAERTQAVLEEMRNYGVLVEALQQEIGLEYDPFDLVCHIAFDQKPLTRRERAENVKKRDYFTRYGPQARAVLQALLDKYAQDGTGVVEDLKVLQLQPFSDMGTPVELVSAFGGRAGYLQALKELRTELYSTA